jgi:hypothetical protein
VTLPTSATLTCLTAWIDRTSVVVSVQTPPQSRIVA